MQFFRYERVKSLIHEKLSQLVFKEIEIPGAIITITSVDVSKKLDRAIASVAVLPPEKAENVLKVLNAQAPMLQHKLLKIINIKPMPRIMFERDMGGENAARVEKILLEDDIESTKE